jgi:hypothetical protein
LLANGNSTGQGKKTVKSELNLDMTLNPRTQAEIEAKAKEKPADIYVNGITSELIDLVAENNPCCELVDGKFYLKTKRGFEVKTNQYVKEKVPLRIKSTANDFSMSIGYPTLSKLQSTFHKFVEVDSNCDADNGISEDETKNWEWDLSGFSLPDGRYGNRFVNPEGELPEGNKVYSLPDGTTITFKWALARCKK